MDEQDRKIRFLEDQLHDIRARHHELKKDYDEAVTKVSELYDQIRELNAQLALVQSEHDMLAERVRDGHLTDTEFQALCHNLDPAQLERFKQGCRDLWTRLDSGRTQPSRTCPSPPEDCHDSPGTAGN